MKSEKEELVAKKPYATPKLTVHGNVEKITESLGGEPTDALGGSSIPSMTD